MTLWLILFVFESYANVKRACSIRLSTLSRPRSTSVSGKPKPTVSPVTATRTGDRRGHAASTLLAVANVVKAVMMVGASNNFW